MFLYDSGVNSLSVCTCAKCGSTSLFQMLHQMVTGLPWVNSGPPWVQEYWRWNVSNVSNSREYGRLHLIMTRDPEERYVSAFHSKVKCCDGANTTLRVPCFEDVRAHFVPGLATLARMRPTRCLTFEEYLYALEEVHRLGQQHKLNPHFRPQHLSCPMRKDVPTIAFDVSQIATLNQLRGFRLRRAPLLRVHATHHHDNVERLRIPAGAAFMTEAERAFVVRTSPLRRRRR